MNREDIHLFGQGERRYCLDVNATTVFEVDEETWAALRTVKESAEPGVDPELPGPASAALADLRDRGFFTGNTRGDRVRSMMQAELPDLLGMSLLVSGKCNLACAYCFNEGGATTGSGEAWMPRDVAFRAVDFLAAHSTGDVGIDFFGGEPLLAPGLIREVCEHARGTGRNFLFSMITNGTVLNDGVLDLLASHPFHVVVSYDGELQDLLRPSRSGQSTRETVRANVRRLATVLPRDELSIRCVFTRQTREVDALIREARELGVRVLFGPVTLPDSDPLAVGPDELRRLLDVQEAILTRAVMEGDLDTLTGVGAISNTVLRAMTGLPRFFSCGIGKDILGVSMSGAFYPCHRFIGLDAFRMGSLDEGLDLAAWSRFRDHHVENRTECRRCWARYFCGGHCAHDAWICGGDFWGTAPERCDFTRLEIELGLKLFVLAMEVRPELLDLLGRRTRLIPVRPLDALRKQEEDA